MHETGKFQSEPGLAPLPLVEDRTPEQLAADGDSPPPAPAFDCVEEDDGEP